MKRALLLLAGMVVASLVVAFSSLAADSKTQYCWLHFGPEARLRILVRLDGQAISLEHYLDGKATGERPAFATVEECKDVRLSDPDGKTQYVITSLSVLEGKADEPAQLMADVDIKGPVSYQQYCDVTLDGDLNQAKLAHFHGPLQVEAQTILWKLPPDLCLERSAKPTDLYATVGTLDRDKGCWVVVRSHVSREKSAFPDGVRPKVEIEFPPAKAGGPPIVKQYPLDEFC